MRSKDLSVTRIQVIWGLLQECTFNGVNNILSVTRVHIFVVNKDLSVIKRDVIWGQKELVCYTKALYIGSVRTCLLQECTLFWVNKDLSVTSVMNATLATKFIVNFVKYCIF